MRDKLVKEWIEKAEHDRIVSQTLIRHRSLNVYEIICFHCQQCIEKYLKGYLTSLNIRYPKTHDLVELVDLVCQKDGSFGFIKDLVEPLTQYAIRFRYPGEEARRPQAQQAIKIMEEARKFIREKMELK